MFSLDLPTAEYEIALPYGVVVRVKPLTAAVLATAQAHATKALAEIKRLRDEMVAIGAPVDGVPDLEAPDVREGQVISALACGLGRHGIVGWRGIAEDWSPEMAEKLMRHADMANAFLREYQAPVMRLAAEGNASAPAPNGSSAAGATTAGDAAMPATPAP